MGQRAAVSRYVVLLMVAGVLAGTGVAAWWRNRPVESAGEPPLARLPLPGFTHVPYLNLGPEARFIGSDACAECHKSNHASYVQTEHSRALADLDPALEPPDGAFEHKLSERWYRIYRQGKEFRQREALRTPDGKEMVSIDVPIRYVIGSGHFCRSYLIEEDGFLHESPITWYTSRQSWDVSPGYDFRTHWSFERPVNVGCIHCHAGRVEYADDSVRVKLHEKAIGCESCHGAGSLHAERHRAKTAVAGEDDYTIVNPGKLSREHLESVCAVCHLNGPASVPLRGRGHADFRPGRPLSDYRVDYRFDRGNEQMTVVGHVEQMRNSKCYQKSSEMTCITCHDPHAKDKPKDLAAYHRRQCLNCHESIPCRLPPEERARKQADDSCAACHMPRGDTDIPHVAFTHHRIGIHGGRTPARASGTPDLLPIGDVSHLSAVDQQRNLGLAYLAVTQDGQYAHLAQAYRERTRALLTPLADAGLADGEVAQALAEVYVESDPARAARYAQQAIDAPDLEPPARAAAMAVRIQCYLAEGNTEQAIQMLQRLTTIRRNVEDWRLLGRLLLERYDHEKALAAYLKALEIRPTRYDVHGGLSELYARLGDPFRARDHLEKSRWLLERRQE